LKKFLFLVMAAILDTGRRWRTHFWKQTTQGSFQQSSPLKLVSQSQPNFAEMFLGWSPFKIVSVSAVLYPEWPPLLKIEISSNGQMEENHPMTISSKFCSYWANGFRQEDFYGNFP
jgi:hypothetical protein